MTTRKTKTILNQYRLTTNLTKPNRIFSFSHLPNFFQTPSKTKPKIPRTRQNTHKPQSGLVVQLA